MAMIHIDEITAMLMQHPEYSNEQDEHLAADESLLIRFQDVEQGAAVGGSSMIVDSKDMRY